VLRERAGEKPKNTEHSTPVYRPKLVKEIQHSVGKAGNIEEVEEIFRDISLTRFSEEDGGVKERENDR